MINMDKLQYADERGIDKLIKDARDNFEQVRKALDVIEDPDICHLYLRCLPIVHNGQVFDKLLDYWDKQHPDAEVCYNYPFNAPLQRTYDALRTSVREKASKWTREYKTARAEFVEAQHARKQIRERMAREDPNVAAITEKVLDGLEKSVTDNLDQLEELHQKGIRDWHTLNGIVGKTLKNKDKDMEPLELEEMRNQVMKLLDGEWTEIPEEEAPEPAEYTVTMVEEMREETVLYAHEEPSMDLKFGLVSGFGKRDLEGFVSAYKHAVVLVVGQKFVEERHCDVLIRKQRNGSYKFSFTRFRVTADGGPLDVPADRLYPVMQVLTDKKLQHVVLRQCVMQDAAWYKDALGSRTIAVLDRLDRPRTALTDLPLWQVDLAKDDAPYVDSVRELSKKVKVATGNMVEKRVAKKKRTASKTTRKKAGSSGSSTPDKDGMSDAMRRKVMEKARMGMLRVKQWEAKFKYNKYDDYEYDNH
jgi:hypothetical protein